MKNKALFLTLVLTCITIQLSAQTFVNGAANGNNDGSSWANAYATLHDALDNYSEDDEIWVAAGTYLPQVPGAWTGVPKSTFYIYQNVQLYGGFNGTETMLSERDPATNITILSGDINGDDDDSDILVNRADNVLNVVHVENNIDASTIIDGFTIRSGQADGNSSTAANQRGGGIWNLGSPQLRNCHLFLNYAALFGGGLYLRDADAGGTLIEDCIFEDNMTETAGAGVIVFTFNSPDTVTLNNCQFISNTSNGNGGGIYGSMGFINLSNCQFTDNTAIFLGGGAFVDTNDGDDSKLYFYNCDFTDNTASNGGGFAFYSSGGDNNSSYFSGCDFISNQASNLDNTSFHDGGAIYYHYNNTTAENESHILENCLIEGNEAITEGGGIAMLQWAGSNCQLELNNCTINGNSTGGDGGGLAILELGAQTINATISNTHFSNNTGSTIQGMALLLDGYPAIAKDIELINCLFTDHNTNDEATSVVGVSNSEIKLTNCTLSDNECTNTSLEGSSIMTLHNTILNNTNYPNFLPISASMLDIISLGGNLASDASLSLWLDVNDLSDTDPLFESGTYQLSANSPAVDAGELSDDAPEFDLAGNARVQGGCIDIGAYESAHDSGVSCLTNSDEVFSSTNMVIAPNPISTVANLSIENQWKGALQISIVNTLGQELLHKTIEKFDNQIQIQLDLSALPIGMYQLSISNGEAIASTPLIKG